MIMNRFRAMLQWLSNMTPSAVKTRVSVVMNRFRAMLQRLSNMTPFAVNTRVSVVDYGSGGEQLPFYQPDDDSKVGVTVATAIKDIVVVSPSPALGYRAVSCLAASVVCSLPGLTPTIESGLREIGVTPLKMKLPSQAGIHVVSLATKRTHVLCSIMFFCQVVLFIFMNLSKDNFKSSVTLWIDGIKARLGIPREEEAGIVVLEFGEARQIKSCLGSIVKVRECVVHALLDIHQTEGSSQFGKVCSYLLSIISWPDMEVSQFRTDMLLISDSPVLHHPCVRGEVIRLVEALLEACSHPYPQFFPILADSHYKRRLFDRSRFPNLIAVARELRKEVANTSQQAAGDGISSSDLVKSLVILHKNSVTNPSSPSW